MDIPRRNSNILNERMAQKKLFVSLLLRESSRETAPISPDWQKISSSGVENESPLPIQSAIGVPEPNAIGSVLVPKNGFKFHNQTSFEKETFV